MISITEEEFNTIRDYVYERLGIHLADHKKSLVEGRLQKLLHEQHFNSFGSYFNHVLNDRSGKALRSLVDRISTNHTFFYREPIHFQYIAEVVLPELENRLDEEKSRDIRFWSAGCSTGEEAFTLAMLLQEYFKEKKIHRWELGVLGTDVSSKAVMTAQEGLYTEKAIIELPVRYKLNYLEHAGGDVWKVTEELRNMVMFRRLNLMVESYPFKKQFHVIFCRNVMIYFDQESRRNLAEKLYKHLQPGGYLFIGHSETLKWSDIPFSYVQPGVYKKKNDNELMGSEEGRRGRY